MLGKHVKVIIHADGACAVDAINFSDGTCTQATRQILQALAGPVVDERYKPEAQRLPPQETRQREGGR